MYRFKGRSGQKMSFEVVARRLGSPLDSYIILYNSRGDKIGENDDMKDPSEGLLTHQADSELFSILPEDGEYSLQIFDTQGNGGEEFSYRLRISPPKPDFELRATPAALSLPRGGSAPLTIHAIRKDGFTGEIKLSLAGSFSGLTLDGATIPEGSDKVTLTVTNTNLSKTGRFTPAIKGAAPIMGKMVTHSVVPAEDLMQAFAYHHLVSFKEEILTVTETPAPFTIKTILPKSGSLEMIPGKDVPITVTVKRRPGFDGPIQVKIEDKPEGISLARGNIPTDRETAVIMVRAEKGAKKLAENLVFSATMTIRKPLPGQPDAPAPKTANNSSTPPSPTPPIVLAAAGNQNNQNNQNPTKPGAGKKNMLVERYTVTIPAVPFKVVGITEAKK
jgi:hypothetical protein